MLLLFSLIALFIILHLNLPANALAGLDGRETRYECNNLARETGQRDAAEDQAVRHASGPRDLFLVGRQQAVDGPHQSQRSRHDSDHLRTDKDDERIYQLTDRILALVERNVVPSLEILPEIAKGKKPCAVGLSLT